MFIPLNSGPYASPAKEGTRQTEGAKQPGSVIRKSTAIVDAFMQGLNEVKNKTQTSQFKYHNSFVYLDLS